MRPWGKRTLLALNFKKILGRTFFKKLVPKESFFCCIRCCLYSLQQTLYIYCKLRSLKEIIQIWIISSKDINLQYLCKVYRREMEQYLMQFDALKKSVMELQIRTFKIVTNEHQYKRATEDEKFIFWRNAHAPVGKQSNQD